MHKLPKRTKSQKIGVSAADIFSATFAEFCNVILVPQDRDLGIDFICEVMKGEYPTGNQFNVQCKGTEEVKSNGDAIHIPIAVTTLNYWLIQPRPTFLIVVDRRKRIFYWTLPKAFLDKLAKDWQLQDTVNIPVPVENCFDLNITELPVNLASVLDNSVAEVFKLISKQLKELHQQLKSQTEIPPTISAELVKASQILEKFRKATSEVLLYGNQVEQATIERLQIELYNYWYLIGKLDYDVPEFKGIMHSDSIFHEPFCAGRPVDVIAAVKTSLADFTIAPSSKNFIHLQEAFSSLIQLNRDIYWVISHFGDSEL